MKIRGLLLPILLVVGYSAQAQLYFCDENDGIGALDLETCTYNYFEGQGGSLSAFPSTLSDIALHPNGNLYGIDGIPQNSDINANKALIQIDLLTREFVDTLALIKDAVTSLVCSSEGIFYFGADNLYSFNPHTNNLIHLGPFPQETDALVGDLAFFWGKLYGTFYLSRDEGAIYEIDPENPSESRQLFRGLYQDQNFGSLTVFQSKDYGEKILVGASVLDGKNPVYRVDLENDSLIHLCDANLMKPHTSPRFWGFTSTDEFRNNYELLIDLDADNSSGRLMDHYQYEDRCTTDYPVADSDIRIQNATGRVIDSLVVTLEATPGAPGEEYFQYTPAPNDLLEVRGNDSPRLVLIDGQGAPSGFFIDILRRVRLHLASREAPSGLRQVNFRIYAGGQVSDPAKAFITARLDEKPDAGEDAYVAFCTAGKGDHLIDVLGGNPSSGGRWEPQLSGGDGFFNTLTDTSGVYRYIVQEGYCPADTAQVEVLLRPRPELTLLPAADGRVEVCPGDSVRWTARSPTAVTYRLGNLAEETIRPVDSIFTTPPGRYFLEVYDAYGCGQFTRLFVTENEEAGPVSTLAASACRGSTFEWRGEVFRRDTQLCQTIPRPGACDSTTCLELNFRPTFQTRETVELCRGAQRRIFGISVSGDTTLCRTVPATGNSCDSTHCVEVRTVPRPESRDTAAICAGETYSFAGQTLSQPGLYRDSTLDQESCDTIRNLLLRVNPVYERRIDTLLRAGESLQLAGMTYSEAGAYELPLQSRAGCDSLILLNLRVDTTTAVHRPASDAGYYAPALVRPGSGGYHGDFRIYARAGRARIRRLEIYDSRGRRVFQREGVWTGSEGGAWKAGAHPPGLYFYRARMASQGVVLTGKVVVYR